MKDAIIAKNMESAVGEADLPAIRETYAPEQVSEAAATASAARIEFVSRYKGLLISLVVLIHTGITYGAVGGWDFVESHDVLWLKVLTTSINSFAQSFVLGAFFFISAYFLPRSLAKKGPSRFLLDRFIKLGIPYLLYYFLVKPLLVSLAEWGKGQRPFTLGPYFDSGPLWFIEALFIFTLFYMIMKLIRRSSKPLFLARGIPNRAVILAYIGIAAALGFAARLVFPIGYSIHNLQLGFFPMYIILFAAGIKAGEEGWLEKVREVRIAPWVPIAVTGMVLYLPLMILGGALTNDAVPFLGGLTWQSAAYSLWEAAVGTSLFIITIVLFARRTWRSSGAGSSFGSASYGIFLMHGMVILPLAVGLHFLPLHPALKWIFLSVCGICLPWLLTLMLRKVPGVSRVL
jgi:glucan biosynthesis protein C